VIEGEKIKEIEKAWLGEQTNCQNSNSRVSYGSLSLKSFWGLFLIAGTGSLLALIISISMFLHKERGKIFIWFNLESSI
jgi:ionotropic glutamate receptor